MTIRNNLENVILIYIQDIFTDRQSLLAISNTQTQKVSLQKWRHARRLC